jgi:integrase
MPHQSAHDIDAMVRAYFWDRLWPEAEDAARTAAKVSASDPLSSDEQLVAWRERESELRTALSARAYDATVTATAKAIIGAQAAPAPETLERASFNLLRGLAEQRRIIQALLRGDTHLIAPADPLFAVANAQPMAHGPLSSVTVSAAVEAYTAHKVKNGEWTGGKTLLQNKAALGLFVELVGPQAQLHKLKDEDLWAFVEAAQTVPSNHTKLPTLKGKPLPEVVVLCNGANQGGKKRSQATVRQYVENARGFLDWASKRYKLPRVGASVTLKKPKKGTPVRRPYTPAELGMLFKSPAFTGFTAGGSSQDRRSKPGATTKRDSKFWIPLIAVFTGARLGEICQLMIADIRTEEGVDFIDINDEGNGKHVKTPSSRRRIPVHPQLREIGFVAFGKERRKQDPTGRLFPDQQPDGHGTWGVAFSKWFGHYCDDIGLKDKKLTFHSFRHAFEDAMRDGKVDGEARKYLGGRTVSGSEGGYGHGYKALLKTLADEIGKVNYSGLDLSHVAKSGSP